jgi:hypothetical protein
MLRPYMLLLMAVARGKNGASGFLFLLTHAEYDRGAWKQ